MSRKHPRYHRQWNLWSFYGLTLKQYDAMRKAQGNKCALCGSPQGKKKQFAVDHNHRTGKVRALLCTKCNSHVLPVVENGLYKLALAYLERYDG